MRIAYLECSGTPSNEIKVGDWCYSPGDDAYVQITEIDRYDNGLIRHVHSVSEIAGHLMDTSLVWICHNSEHINPEKVMEFLQQQYPHAYFDLFAFKEKTKEENKR